MVVKSYPLKALNIVAAIYASASTLFLATFIIRFHGHGISSNPTDWTSMSEMLGAAFGPPLALWSIALVLKSIQLQQAQVTKQQNQYDQMLERENLRLDPGIRKIELATAPMWKHGSFGGRTFNLTVDGDATWHCSTIPDGPNPVAITNPDGTVEVVLWKKWPSGTSYRAFLQYKRSNGTEGWYRVAVIVDGNPKSGLGFSLSKVSGPIEVEDRMQMEVSQPA